ncbi:hypothetical protein [Nonomuraea sp. NPDC048916]|uniref:hypothetical protein n=1 Tax=Nonomuraea sp. NPDC048916 TaxID=3154232 RepID=UPI0033FC2AA9
MPREGDTRNRQLDDLPATADQDVWHDYTTDLLKVIKRGVRRRPGERISETPDKPLPTWWPTPN